MGREASLDPDPRPILRDSYNLQFLASRLISRAGSESEALAYWMTPSLVESTLRYQVRALSANLRSDRKLSPGQKSITILYGLSST